MKYLAICMFALVAASMAGETKKEKRGLLGLGDAGFAGIHGGISHGYAAPAISTYAAPLAHHAPIVHEQAYISSAPAPAAIVSQVAQRVHQHTHTVERVNVPVPYQVDRTIVKHVPIDRPVPQPYPVEVIKHIPQPYTVDRPVPQPYQVPVHVSIPKPYPVPVDRVQTIIEKVPVPQPYTVDRPIPQPYPVYVQHQQPAIAIQHQASPIAYAAAPAIALDLHHHHHHGAIAHQW